MPAIACALCKDGVLGVHSDKLFSFWIKLQWCVVTGLKSYTIFFYEHLLIKYGKCWLFSFDIAKKRMLGDNLDRKPEILVTRTAYVLQTSDTF